MPRIIICPECSKEKTHHAQGLCWACYLKRYRETQTQDRWGGSHQVKKARKAVRQVVSKLLLGIDTLAEQACPYFATKEELLALTNTVNQIHQREIDYTDAELEAAAEEFPQLAQAEIKRSVPQTKLRTEELKKKRNLFVVDENSKKPN
jgi:hypothetical protein